MDPVTAVTLAAAIAKTTGLGELIGRKLGGEKGARTAQIVLDTAQVVTGAKDPQEALQRLQQDAELAFQLQMRLIESEELAGRLEQEDRASARDLQKQALAQDDLFSKRFVYYFAGSWSVFAMLFIFGITFADIPKSNEPYVHTVLGFLLGTIISTMIAYFYGSSRGSFHKDEGLMSAINALNKRR